MFLGIISDAALDQFVFWPFWSDGFRVCGGILRFIQLGHSSDETIEIQRNPRLAVYCSQENFSLRRRSEQRARACQMPPETLHCDVKFRGVRDRRQGQTDARGRRVACWMWTSCRRLRHGRPEFPIPTVNQSFQFLNAGLGLRKLPRIRLAHGLSPIGLIGGALFILSQALVLRRRSSCKRAGDASEITCLTCWFLSIAAYL